MFYFINITDLEIKENENTTLSIYHYYWCRVFMERNKTKHSFIPNTSECIRSSPRTPFDGCQPLQHISDVVFIQSTKLLLLNSTLSFNYQFMYLTVLLSTPNTQNIFHNVSFLIYIKLYDKFDTEDTDIINKVSNPSHIPKIDFSLGYHIMHHLSKKAHFTMQYHNESGYI